MTKIRGIILSLWLFLSFSINLFAAGPHKLSFTVKGLRNTMVFLGYHFGDKSYKLDSLKLETKSSFEFSGKDELPGGVYFILLKEGRYFEFIIDKEQKFSMQCDTVDFINSMKITGSPENSLFYEYLKYVTAKHTEIEKYEKENSRAGIDSVNAEVKRYKEKFEKAHPDYLLSKIFAAGEVPVIPPSPKLANGRIDSTFPYRYYKYHFFDDMDFSEDRLVRSPVFFPRIKEYLNRLTPQIPDSIIVAADYLISKVKPGTDMFKFLVTYITSTYEASNVMGMDAVFVHMVKKYYSPEQTPWIGAKQLQNMVERATQLDPILIGKKCPEIALPDTSNVIRPLSQVRARYTILYFWDYDCGFCQKETPKLVKWYDSIKGEGIEVYAVETNENEVAKWKDYIKKNKLDWINVTDIFHTDNIHQRFDIIATPVIYVLDENKNIIAKKIEIQDLNKVLRNDMEKHKNK